MSGGERSDFEGATLASLDLMGKRFQLHAGKHAPGRSNRGPTPAALRPAPPVPASSGSRFGSQVIAKLAAVSNLPRRANPWNVTRRQSWWP